MAAHFVSVLENARLIGVIGKYCYPLWCHPATVLKAVVNDQTQEMAHNTFYSLSEFVELQTSIFYQSFPLGQG